MGRRGCLRGLADHARFPEHVDAPVDCVPEDHDDHDGEDHHEQGEDDLPARREPGASPEHVQRQGAQRREQEDQHGPAALGHVAARRGSLRAVRDQLRRDQLVGRRLSHVVRLGVRWGAAVRADALARAQLGGAFGAEVSLDRVAAHRAAFACCQQHTGTIPFFAAKSAKTGLSPSRRQTGRSMFSACASIGDEASTGREMDQSPVNGYGVVSAVYSAGVVE